MAEFAVIPNKPNELKGAEHRAERKFLGKLLDKTIELKDTLKEGMRDVFFNYSTLIKSNLAVLTFAGGVGWATVTFNGCSGGSDVTLNEDYYPDWTATQKNYQVRFAVLNEGVDPKDVIEAVKLAKKEGGEPDVDRSEVRFMQLNKNNMGKVVMDSKGPNAITAGVSITLLETSVGASTKKQFAKIFVSVAGREKNAFETTMFEGQSIEIPIDSHVGSDYSCTLVLVNFSEQSASSGK